MVDMSIGGTFLDFLNNINMFGMGADLPILLIALFIAIAVCQKELRDGKYTNLIGIFMISSLAFFGTGIMTNWVVFGAIVIIGSIELIVSESSRHYRLG